MTQIVCNNQEKTQTPINGSDYGLRIHDALSCWSCYHHSQKRGNSIANRNRG